MDLFAAAMGNTSSLDSRVDSLRRGSLASDRDSLDRFSARVEQEGRIGVNMRQSTLLAFLTTAGQHENMYEWVAARARRSSLGEDEILRRRLGRYYEARLTFDRNFVDGSRFRYGALNIGGAGATSYGDCCAIVGAPPPDWRVAYLRADSLNTYMLPGPSVDEAALAADTAPHSHRQHLALLKHAAVISQKPEPLWPGLVCSSRDYIEAIFVGDLQPTALACVRMQRTDHDLYFDLAFNDFRTKLSDADRTSIETFVMLLDALEQTRISIEVIDDA